MDVTTLSATSAFARVTNMCTGEIAAADVSGPAPLRQDVELIVEGCLDDFDNSVACRLTRSLPGMTARSCLQPDLRDGRGYLFAEGCYITSSLNSGTSVVFGYVYSR